MFVPYPLAMYFGKRIHYPPEDGYVGFQPSPMTRGTLTIIWTSVTTIFSCVYVALHFDVPAVEHGAWWRWLYKLLLAMAALVAPEYMLSKAAAELALARSLTKTMQRSGGHRGSFSEASGYSSEPLISSGKRDLRSGQKWRLAHSYFAIMGGFCDSSGHSLTHKNILYFYKHDTIPDFSHNFDNYYRDIKDKSKADPLVKLLVCTQVTWFLANAIARVVLKLPISQLELVACGYIPIALGTYICWWEKPYNVGAHIYLPVETSAESVAQKDTKSHGDIWGLIVGLLGSFIFGACHLIAWNDVFVNTNGQLLWRVCSVIVTALPLLSLIPTIGMGSESTKTISMVAVFIFGFVYISARISLLLLTGLSFWSLPAGVYIDTRWAAFLPRFG